MYTNDAEVPLRDVLESIKEKENAGTASIDPKKATAEELRAYLTEVLPDFDRERVYMTDIKKLISWYNILVTNGITEFKDDAEQQEEAVETDKYLLRMFITLFLFLLECFKQKGTRSVLLILYICRNIFELSFIRFRAFYLSLLQSTDF